MLTTMEFLLLIFTGAVVGIGLEHQVIDLVLWHREEQDKAQKRQEIMNRRVK